ncbi:glutathione s-transferase domain-containing protein [Schizothecium vesticola]|uniref:Glutathione s-transferase domain-containing protein n=1 Tax=Schizothecium vesticola TaxID=314040 RepID=A0AA40FB82_9PEZI|nr:glutathione s-transferase domain-containing protein [Schizothecium vesticola]
MSSPTTPPPSYTLFITHKNYSSWSLRPHLLLHELAIPFTPSLQPLLPSQPRQPQWKAFSPTARVPCLHDTSHSPPLVLWDSLAIVEHLAEAHPDKPVYPSSPPARAWARSATAEMHAGFERIRDEMSTNVGLRVRFFERDRGGVSPALAAELERVDELWTEGLRRFGGPWLAGEEFGAVDAFYAPMVLRMQTFVGAVEFLGEEARGYVERVLELEGVKEWVADAVKEVNREPNHDEQTIAGRQVLADYRATRE